MNRASGLFAAILLAACGGGGGGGSTGDDDPIFEPGPQTKKLVADFAALEAANLEAGRSAAAPAGETARFNGVASMHENVDNYRILGYVTMGVDLQSGELTGTVSNLSYYNDWSDVNDLAHTLIINGQVVGGDVTGTLTGRDLLVGQYDTALDGFFTGTNASGISLAVDGTAVKDGVTKVITGSIEAAN